MSDSDIERRIVTGLIVSTDFVRRVSSFWRPDFLEAPELVKIAEWCLDYFEQYNQAPTRHIEDIYMRELKGNRLAKAEAEFMERILSRISDDYERGEAFNAEYLFDRATEYFRARDLLHFKEELEDLIERGEVDAADEAQRAFKPTTWGTSRGIDVGSEEGLRRLSEAFTTTSVPVVQYPGALGVMLNQHLVRGGFVGLMGPEKRGKTFWLMDIGFRSLWQKMNVAFFQAGDLTEAQFLRRTGIYIARRSDQEVYCRKHWRPIGDCVFNQLNTCTIKGRNCDFGVFEGTPEEYKNDRTRYTTYDALVEAAEAHPDYRPCDKNGCTKRWPTAWVVEEAAVTPLNGKTAQRSVDYFFKKYRRRLKLSTHATGTLSVNEIESILGEWERQDDFVPDVIIVDYADIMTARVSEFRHQQNEIWKQLRSLSQKKHALVVTATQADAASYRSNSMSLSNFSEDKRKYAHVTAMFGLNQSPDGREKKLGLMRLNELVIREGAAMQVEVTVLQNLRQGRAFLESYAVGLQTPPPRGEDV